jgi:hypothetical protein
MPPASWAPLAALGNEGAARFGCTLRDYLIELYRETFKKTISRP